MAYLRTIKQTFFTSEDIVTLSPPARLLYIGLWTEADREGRLRWKPVTFKLRYLPTDVVDMHGVCQELLDRQLVIRYGDGLAYIPSFTTHQRPNAKEVASGLPAPDGWNHAFGRVDENDPRVGTRESRVETRAGRVREGKEREGKEREGTGREDACDHASGTASVIHPDWGAHPAKKRKGHCGWESAIGVDVPTVLHDEFVAKLASGGDAQADATLHGWYRDTEAAYRGQVVGDDSFVFWRARFKEWRGSTVKAAAKDDQARIFEKAMAQLGVRA